MKRKRGDLNCWHCDAFSTLNVTVFDIYHCNLCQDCRNDLQRALGDSPLALLKSEIETKIAIIGVRTAADGIDRTEECLFLIKQAHENEKVLRDLAEAWVKGRDDGNRT